MGRSLNGVLLGTFTLRFSTGLTGAMLQFYLADLAKQNPAEVTGAAVGVLAATFYLAELLLSPFFGILGDRYGHHRIMLLGPAFGAVAVVMTAVTTNLFILGGTRWLEGASTAASVPAILGFIAIVTAGDEARRGRAASRFEMATLAGLGVGFIVGPSLFAAFHATAFLLNAVMYCVSFLIYWRFVEDPEGERAAIAAQHAGLARYRYLLTHSHIWLLAPTWVAVNASIGLWFSQSLFQLAKGDPTRPDQWLLQGFGTVQITGAAIVIALVFGAGIIWWGDRFAIYRRTTIILFGIAGGVGMVIGGLIVNHAAFGAGANPLLALVVIASVVLVGAGLFVLAGATPAAVGLLADVSEGFPGDRGAIMGLYSVFLGVGQIAGALLGGLAADWGGMDGLLIATGALLLVALLPLSRLRQAEHYVGGPATAAHVD